ncbi:SAF domain-containing protein, partial [Acinetobacter baumannii]
LDATKKASQVAQDDLNARLNAKGKAVFALKDIPEGQLITADALEEREMAATQVPTDAISAASLVAGRTAKYGISANQIVSQHDLASATVPQGF